MSAGDSSRRRGSGATEAMPFNDLSSPVYLTAAVAPRPAAIVGRPFAYLGLCVFWLAVFAAGLFAAFLALPGAVGAAAGDDGLAGSALFRHSDSWLAVVVLPFLALVFGYLTIFIVLASLGTFLMALTLFVRSLRRGYRREQLSLTVLSRGGEAVGPMTTAVTGVALSLLPVRLTRWTKLLMVVQFNGWIINVNALTIGFAWGCTYLFTVGWLLWPVSGVTLVVCAAISVALAVWTGWLIWRRRTAFVDVVPAGLRGSVYANSWPRASRAAVSDSSRRSKPKSAS